MQELKRHSQEEKDLIKQLKAQGMNRRDRVALIDAARSGDQAALSTLGDIQKKEPADSSPSLVAGSQSAEQIAAVVERDTEFRVTGDMEEIGQTAAGLDRLDASLLRSLDPEGTGALLYDDVTGKIYRTTDWGDVQKNADSLVDRSGERQRVFGINRKEDRETGEYSYAVRNVSAAFGTDVVVGLGEKIPELGSQAFAEWAEKKFYEGQYMQASSHRWTKEHKSTGTHYGGYGSISVADWIELGRPKKLGTDTIMGWDSWREKTEGLSVEDVNPNALLMTVDQEERSHGIEKGLNKIGGAVGYDRLGRDFGHTMENLGELGVVPTLGLSIIGKTYASMTDAYNQSRDLGHSSGGALKEAGKAGGYAVAESAIDAAQVVLVAAAVATGGATLAGAVALGALAGAAAGYVGGALKYGAHSTLYGGYDSGDQLKQAEKAGAAGAISGAVSGFASYMLPGAGQGSWGGFGEHAFQTAGKMALNAGESYVVGTEVYGMSGHDASQAALHSAITVPVSSFAAQAAAPRAEGESFWSGNRFTRETAQGEAFSPGPVQRKSPYAAALPDGTTVLGKLGNGIQAFREEVALRSFSGSRVMDATTGGSFLRNTVGIGTDTMRMYRDIQAEAGHAGARLTSAEYRNALSGMNRSIDFGDYSDASYPFRVANIKNYFPGGVSTVPSEAAYETRHAELSGLRDFVEAGQSSVRGVGGLFPDAVSGAVDQFADRLGELIFESQSRGVDWSCWKR